MFAAAANSEVADAARECPRQRRHHLRRDCASGGVHSAFGGCDHDREVHLACGADQLVRPLRQAFVRAVFGEHRSEAENHAALGDYLVQLAHPREEQLAIARRGRGEPGIGGNAQRLHFVAGVHEGALGSGEEIERVFQPPRLTALRELQAGCDRADADWLRAGRVVRGGEQVGHGGKRPQRSEQSEDLAARCHGCRAFYSVRLTRKPRSDARDLCERDCAIETHDRIVTHFQQLVVQGEDLRPRRRLRETASRAPCGVNTRLQDSRHPRLQ